MRSRVEVLQEYQRYYAELLSLNPNCRESIEKRDAPERRHRWRVELDCGCTTEALTYGKEHPPTDGRSHRLFKGGLHSVSRNAFVIDAGSWTLDMTPGIFRAPATARKARGGRSPSG
jgi:hypothetical protein